jgi:hypothetical protein
MLGAVALTSGFQHYLVALPCDLLSVLTGCIMGKGCAWHC